MNIAEAKQQLADTVEAYLATDESGLSLIPAAQQRPLFLIGAPGIGKTAIMTQVADELGIGIVSYSMTHHTRQSALGLPFIVHENFEGFEYDASEYTMSEIIASIYDYMRETGLRKGILFLDEINCVSETLYPSMLQFLQHKTFGRHKVPKDWVVVCAGNPPEYNRSVHEFDVVTLDRMRRIEVEPDYHAWRSYALNAGVHPSVLSFLEIRKDCFYSIQQTPAGKSFATARGWDDLSAMIQVNERLNKSVNLDLITQFIQDPEIAERFGAYYRLFEKYRSDYNVDGILAGDAGSEIEQRARSAEFDERIALIGLILDSLSGSLSENLELKDILMNVRDILRNIKEQLASGADVTEALSEAISSKESELTRRLGSGTAGHVEIRKLTRSIDMLRDLRQGALENVGSDSSKDTGASFGMDIGTDTDTSASLSMNADASVSSNKEIFDHISRDYASRAETFKRANSNCSRMIDNAFAFMDRVYGQRSESVIFVTEMTSRRACSRFVNEFGSDSYFAHNESLMVDEHRKDIMERIEGLGLPNF